MTITQRPATVADVEGIVAVFLGCWSVTYATVLPKALVAAMTTSRASALWTRVLDEASEGDVSVAETAPVPGSGGPVIAGVTRVSISESCEGRPQGTVQSLYVAPAAQGRGIGSMLLTAAGERLSSAGVETGALWVFRDNAPAIAFYRRAGWLPDGTTRVQAEFGEPEVRLTKPFGGGVG